MTYLRLGAMNKYDEYDIIMWKWRSFWRVTCVPDNVELLFAHLPDFIKVKVSDDIAFYIDDYKVFSSADGFNGKLTECNKLRIAKVIEKAMRTYSDEASARFYAHRDKLNATINAALGDKLPPSH
jgi:hypothetical protein